MKKFFLPAIVACSVLASCEDVPAPYELFDPNNAGGQGGGSTSALPYTDANLSDWKPLTVKGVAWSLGNTYAKASGYANGSTTESEAWLVSPAINLQTEAEAVHVELDHVIRYVNASTAPLSNHTMWITTEQVDDVTTASWTQLDYKPVESATQTWDFYAADQIAIPSEFLNKTVYVAFKFVCGSSSTTWELKNFSIKEGAAAEGGNNQGGGNTGGGDNPPVTGAGSKAEPYSVAAAQNASGNGWVKGYIVGYIDGQTYATGAKFEVPAQAETEILIADAADCTDATKCMPIQLPAGDIRTALELNANPTLLKQEVQLYGSIEKYFGVTGLKSTSCALLGDKVIGKDPEDNTPEPPVGDVTGTGTEADPFNVAGILNYTKALAADVSSTDVLYFKGKVSTVKEISTKDNYNNATFYISDDGTASNEFYIFRCQGLGKADIESADLVKVGDEVVICGKVVNYKGNTPETVQKDAYIVSINGEGGSGDNGGGGDNGGDNGGSGDNGGGDNGGSGDPVTSITNGDFETWADGIPTGWKSASTASSATLSQSTDAHGGSYSVKVAGATANKRLAYQETLLEAGTYTVKYFAKSLGGATSQYGAQTRAGYVPVTDGSVGTYVYDQNYATLSETAWTEVTYTFTLDAATTVCLVVMNPKNCGDMLIDDYTITKQ